VKYYQCAFAHHDPATTSRFKGSSRPVSRYHTNLSVNQLPCGQLCFIARWLGLKKHAAAVRAVYGSDEGVGWNQPYITPKIWPAWQSNPLWCQHAFKSRLRCARGLRKENSPQWTPLLICITCSFALFLRLA